VERAMEEGRKTGRAPPQFLFEAEMDAEKRFFGGDLTRIDSKGTYSVEGTVYKRSFQWNRVVMRNVNEPKGKVHRSGALNLTKAIWSSM